MWLLIQEAFNAHLGGFLEGGVEHFHFGNFTVGRKRLVGFSAYSIWDCGPCFVVHIFRKFGVNQCCNLAITVHHKALVNILTVCQHSLQFFGIYVLARAVENHRFDATSECGTIRRR